MENTTTVDTFAKYYYDAMRRVEMEEEAKFFSDSYAKIAEILKHYYDEDGFKSMRTRIGSRIGDASHVVSKPNYDRMTLSCEVVSERGYSQLITDFIGKIEELFAQSTEEKEKNVFRMIFKDVKKRQQHYEEMRKLYENGVPEGVKEIARMRIQCANYFGQH